MTPGTRPSHFFCAALAFAFAAGTAPAAAQYPERNVVLIVPYGAGGGTDITARMLAKDLEAVPSATVAGYFIEGHVHADQIKELLNEKPQALGLTVPGLPLGAPGREFSSPTCDTACTVLDKDSAPPRVRRELYETLLVKKDGKTSTYARH